MGQYHSAFKGQGMTFSEVRPYQFGDEIRRIDWNKTARFREPYVKVMEEERELTVMLMVDISASMDYGTSHALKREYAKNSGDTDHNLEPKDMFDIAEGTREGNREAVLKTFEDYGEIAGDAMATAATLIDGLIVIGGGITAARKYIMPALLKEMRGQLQRMNGETISRLQFKVYDLDDFNEFVIVAAFDPLVEATCLIEMDHLVAVAR